MNQYKIKLQDNYSTRYSLQVRAKDQDVAVQIAKDTMLKRFSERQFSLLKVEESY